MVLLGVIVLGGVANYMKIPLSVVTLGGAVILMISERRIAHRLKKVSWNVILFVIGLFIVVKGLDVSGVASAIGETMFANMSNNILVATVSVSLLSAFIKRHLALCGIGVCAAYPFF